MFSLNPAINNVIHWFSVVARRLGFDFHESRNSNVQAMLKTIQNLGGIRFAVEVNPDGTWVAESTNIEGIMAGGFHYPDDLATMERDAIFAYFRIPPQLCNNSLLRVDTEPVRIAQRVYA